MITINTEMAKAFAAEMDTVFANTRKYSPIMNFMMEVKVGTSRNTNNGIKRNFIVQLLPPFGKTCIKGWVFMVDGKVTAESVVWLLEAAVKQLALFEKALDAYKSGSTYLSKDFVETVEKYGVADLEDRVEEMNEYFKNLTL